MCNEVVKMSLSLNLFHRNLCLLSLTVMFHLTQPRNSAEIEVEPNCKCEAGGKDYGCSQNDICKLGTIYTIVIRCGHHQPLLVCHSNAFSIEEILISSWDIFESNLFPQLELIHASDICASQENCRSAGWSLEQMLVRYIIDIDTHAWNHACIVGSPFDQVCNSNNDFGHCIVGRLSFFGVLFIDAGSDTRMHQTNGPQACSRVLDCLESIRNVRYSSSK
mmetsp:Transcript_15265/g.33428  ORF Transcript_15265/g.33428 Transcript_15265/m.33428 type:complete len:220 (-) Transcript_15265:1192-1851(-)